MPELPEVETIRRQLCAAGIEGRKITGVEINWYRLCEPVAPPEFSKRLLHRTIKKLDRHGKWLIFQLTGKENLLVHLRMTGGFYLSTGRLKKGQHDRAVLKLSGGLNLHFRDPRKFGRWKLAAGAPEKLGPDALTVTKKEFFEQFTKKNKALKALLLDQEFIAGVGNIYADEALFEAKLHPLRKSGTLTPTEREQLYRAVVKVIRAGVKNKGTSLGDGQGNFTDLNGESGGYRVKVKAYGRAGEPCESCGIPLEKITVAQRTTVFCPGCQK
ncbi:MAG: bifunctional DNA-formamidopyrimidine glycosylase/DNA-(apurinic or apyrimidinic site) lyase [Kiritimatiellales bacterium]